MALTQNKYLIVTEAPDGNTQLVTTSAYGDTEIDGLDEWEVSAGKLQPKAGVAPNGVSIATAPTSYAKLFADYTSVGANLVDNASTYENDIAETDVTSGNKQTSDSAPFAMVASDTIGSGAGYGLWNAMDSSASTYYLSANSGVPHWIRIDFDSTPKTVLRYDITGIAASPNNTPIRWILQGSNDATTSPTVWTDIDDRNSSDNAFTPNYGPSAKFTVTSPNSYRHYRLYVTKNVGGGNYTQIANLVFYEDVYSTALNTADTNMFTGSASNFAPASLVITDETDTNITGTGKVNVDYKLNNGSFTASLVDIETFRALPASTFANLTQLDLQFQPVGDIRIKDPTIDSESSESLLLASGALQALANAVVVGTMSADGYTFPDATIQSTAINKVDAPASASATGTTGQIAWDTAYIYICTATDTWKRVAVATW